MTNVAVRLNAYSTTVNIEISPNDDGKTATKTVYVADSLQQLWNRLK